MIKRIIPILLLKGGGLVKSIKFKNYRYIGDPINAVRIFNDKEVDELVFLDIQASKNSTQPDYNLIKEIASECFMPFAYGGGVTELKQIEKLINIGVEKIILNSILLNKPNFINEAAKEFGSQSIVASIDIKKNFLGKIDVFSHKYGKTVNINPFTLTKELQQAGVGEIIINFVDKDGTFEGYDYKLINQLVKDLNLPVVVAGGAKNYEDMFNVLKLEHVSAAAAGSLFVFHGKLHAVLINYPSRIEINKYLI